MHVPYSHCRYEIDACRSLCIQQKVIDDCACVTNKQLLTMSMREEHLFCGHMNYTDYDWTYDRVLCAQQALTKGTVRRGSNSSISLTFSV